MRWLTKFSDQVSARCPRRLSSGVGDGRTARPHSASWWACLVWEVDTPPQQTSHPALSMTPRVPSPILNRLHRPPSRPALAPCQTAATTPLAPVSTSSPYHTGHAAYFPCPPQRAKVLRVYPMQMNAPRIRAPHPHADCCLRRIFPRPHPRRPIQIPLVMNQAPIQTMPGCLYLFTM